MWKVLGILLFATGISCREVSNQMKIHGVQYSSPAGIQTVVHPAPSSAPVSTLQERPQPHPQVAYHSPPPQYAESSPAHLGGESVPETSPLRHYQPHPSQGLPQAQLRPDIETVLRHYQSGVQRQPHPSQDQNQPRGVIRIQPAVDLPVPESHGARVVGVSAGVPYPGPHLPPYSAVPYDNSPYPVQGSPAPYPYPGPVGQGSRELLRVGGIYAVGPSEEIVEEGPPPGSRGAFNPFSFGLGGFGEQGQGQIVSAPAPHPPVAYYSKEAKAYRYNHNQPVHTLGPASQEGAKEVVVGVRKGVPLPVGVRMVTRGQESAPQAGHEEYESGPIVMGKGASPGPRYVLRPQASAPEGPPPPHQLRPYPSPEEYQESLAPSPHPYSAAGPPTVTYNLGGGRGPPRHVTYSPVSGPPPPPSGPHRHLEYSPVSGLPSGPRHGPDGSGHMSLMEYLSNQGLRSAPPGFRPSSAPPPGFLSSGPPPTSYEAQSQPSLRRPVTYSFPSPPRRHFLAGPGSRY